MYGSVDDPDGHMDDGLGEFFLTLDESTIESHPLDGGEPGSKPALLPTNVVVLEAFWQLNGFRDGMGGAIMPTTIEWWIKKEEGRLTVEQARDIRDLVPVADQHWRGLQIKKMENERTEGG